MSDVLYEGVACLDCAMTIANGDTSGIDDYPTWNAGVTRQALYEIGNVFMACDEDCDGGFSWASCDYCGSTLGGDRHPIVVLG